MAKEKITESFEIEADHKKWLDEMVEKHDLPDASKTLRVLLDFAMEDGDQNTIFEQIRCLHC